MGHYQENLPLEEVYNVLMHYGTPHQGNTSHSGRYRYGSGENPFQHGGDLIKRVEMLKAKGLSETDIAKGMGLTTTQLRAQLSLAKSEKRSELVTRAKSLRDKGYSLNEIAEEMGYDNNSSIRSLLNADSEARMNVAMQTADALKQLVKEKGYIDVGVGADRELGISKEKLDQALYILELEGYPTYTRGVAQVTNPGKQTNVKVLCPQGTEWKDIYAEGALDNIHSVKEYKIETDADGNDVLRSKYERPSSLDASRVMIRYAEDGGVDRDGVIEIRRGVADLDLQGSNYAQVRIMVDGTHYIKGMAVYTDSDLPDGVDILFNTNKSKGTPMCGPKNNTVLKPIKADPDNPFGALLRQDGGQYHYTGADGKDHLSPLNKTRQEGDWGDWAKNIPSQFLGKQNISLIHRQLDLTKVEKKSEFDEIMSLTNPTVKKALLKSFADDCDSAAIHLKAAALPRQKYQVLLPSKTIGDNEVYAPNYKDGEYVALVRFPHGGTFEIPILRVNNKNAECQKLIGKNPIDAIGISKNTADRLSGADFDGDTAMVIPTLKSNGERNRAVANANNSNRVAITSTDPLKGLEGFDPKMAYGGKPEGTFKVMHNTQNEMGRISNLITDMTLKGANSEELARAVRHSMVVIDAEKHKLDYKQSEKDNGIAALRKKYQYNVDPVTGKESGGASTLLSRAKSQTQVEKRKGSPIIDPETGKQTWKPANETYIDPKDGKVKKRMINSTKMAETDDAMTLVSSMRTKQELAYAEYANYMKDLANKSRKAMVNEGKIAYSKSAKNQYQSEVDSLERKLTAALKNAPKERQAQIMANAVVDAKKRDNPDLKSDKKAVKKLAQTELVKARERVGAHRTSIDITDKEWEAIQAGAISENKLTKIINNTDTDRLRQLATPRNSRGLNDAQVARAKAMKASGYTMEQIADTMGVSASTVAKYTKG